MIVESWITPEETPALAALAQAVIDTNLARFSEAERAAYWASIRKAYNTPYNPPVKAAKIVEPASITVDLVEETLPVAVMAQGVRAAEAHAA